MNIPHHSRQIFTRIDQNSLIAAPKQRSISPMTSVESLCVHTIDMTHHSLEISLWGLQSQVVVGVHETIRKNSNTPPAPSILN
jgi:hypothetical protein